MKTIKVKNWEILVDNDDYDELSKFKWRIRKNGNTFYASSCHYGMLFNMHTFLVKSEKGKVVDHKDGNGLNNQKNNLRVITHQQNIWNSRKKNCNTSGYIGVRLEGKKWRAQIKVCGKNKHLGLFKTLEEAKESYRQAAVEQRGEYARY